MADFMRWLQNPHQDVKVTPLFPKQPIRKAKTVNIIINTVLGFYDYLMRHEDYSIQLTERLKKQVYLASKKCMKRQLKMYPLANIIANYCNNDSLYLWLSPLNTTK